jgi:hypothetical protein
VLPELDPELDPELELELEELELELVLELELEVDGLLEVPPPPQALKVSTHRATGSSVRASGRTERNGFTSEPRRMDLIGTVDMR